MLHGGMFLQEPPMPAKLIIETPLEEDVAQALEETTAIFPDDWTLTAAGDREGGAFRLRVDGPGFTTSCRFVLGMAATEIAMYVNAMRETAARPAVTQDVASKAHRK
jgi:hypothetical protein